MGATLQNSRFPCFITASKILLFLSVFRSWFRCASGQILLHLGIAEFGYNQFPLPASFLR